MVQEAPIRADMRDPRNERFFSRVWERFFAELPGEIESVTEQNIESGIAMANYFAEQLEKLIESIPPPQDYLHRIEELENEIASTPTQIDYLHKITELENEIEQRMFFMGGF